MISAGDFKNGLTIELEGNVYQIVDFQHVKPGKARKNFRQQSYLFWEVFGRNQMSDMIYRVFD